MEKRSSFEHLGKQKWWRWGAHCPRLHRQRLRLTGKWETYMACEL